MSRDIFGSAQKFVEGSLHLPTLSQVTEVFRNLPDEIRLKLVRDILREASQLSEHPEQLELALSLIRVISDTPIQKLEVLRGIIQGLTRLARLLPKDGLKSLPIKDFLEEMKR